LAINFEGICHVLGKPFETRKRREKGRRCVAPEVYPRFRRTKALESHINKQLSQQSGAVSASLCIPVRKERE
jgi:hypothetical protein